MKDAPAAPAELLNRLSDFFGERYTENDSVRLAHGQGEGGQEPFPPSAVVFARSTEDVIEAVKLCREYRTPIIPYGAGSSLEGQLAAVNGGVSLDVAGMDAVLEVNEADLDCRVQAGVTREALNAHIRDCGLFFPLDPGHNATLGGMAATRASGTNAVRYGTMKDVVLGLEVVTAYGEVVRTGGRARKSSAGYDLTRLFIGSEGTLGVITELQLRLFGRPEHVASGVVQFADLHNAIDAVIVIIQMGIPIARIELLDAVQMQACVNWSKLDEFAPAPTLFLEFHGSPSSVADQIGQTLAILEEHGGDQISWADRPEDRTRLWKARHEAYHAGRSLAPGKASFATDACVPISRLADAILASKREADRLDLVAPIVGHVGDGNFHANILFDPDDAGESARAKTLATYIANLAIELGGTCTGEHGVGLNKLEVVASELGGAAAVMRRVKGALDPENIFNPGKTVPQ